MERCIVGYGMLYAARQARMSETPEQRWKRQRRVLWKEAMELEAMLNHSSGERIPRKTPTPAQQRATVKRGLMRAIKAYEDSQRSSLLQRPIGSSASYTRANYQPSPAYAV